MPLAFKLALKGLEALLIQDDSPSIPAYAYGLEHYEPLRVVGEGAFGLVVLAKDRRLERTVAIKFIHPERTRTFPLLAEARLLASLDHPNICRIYEVGEIEGQPYLVMPYLEGPSLEDAAPAVLQGPGGATRLAKILAVCAEAVWYAHVRGLVHRDLRAANVLLQGDQQPIVLDFGLAARQEDEPAWDMRHDVWALGEMLYTLLGGYPSATGPSSMALHPAEVTPRPPLRSIGKDLSPDLEAILTRALSPEIEDRYESAQQLAEDLHRFVEGRPVQARPVGKPVRLRMWALRNPALALSIGIGSLVALGLGTTQIIQQRRATQSLRFTQRFTREAEQIESLLQRVFAMPEGDIAGFITQVRGRMKALRSEAPNLPRSGQAALHYALGRAHAALGEWTEAKKDLDQAANLGFQGPELDYTRGLAYARRYLDELRGVHGKAREEKLKTLRPSLLEPASRWLREGRNLSLGDPDLGQATIALMEERREDALALAERAAAEHPYAWDPLLFQCRIFRERALQASTLGQQEEAAQNLIAAKAILDRAATLGRSAPSVFYERLAQFQFQNHLYGLKESIPGVAFPEVQAAALAVLTRDPGHAAASLVLLDAYSDEIGQRRTQGQDASELIRQGLQLGARAVQERAEDANLWRTYGDFLEEASKEPGLAIQEAGARLQRSTEAYQIAVKLLPEDFATVANLASNLTALAEFQFDHGQDSSSALQQGREAFQQALKLRDHPLLRLNLARHLGMLGRWQSLKGAQVPAFAEAIQAFKQGAAPNPDHIQAAWVGGRLYRLQAEHLAAHDGDPLPALAEARAWFLRGLKGKPTSCQFRAEPLILQAMEARWRLAKKEDVSALMAAIAKDEAAFLKTDQCSDWKEELQVQTSMTRLLMAHATGRWDASAYQTGEGALKRMEGPRTSSAEYWLLRAKFESASDQPEVPGTHRDRVQAELASATKTLKAVNSNLDFGHFTGMAQSF